MIYLSDNIKIGVFLFLEIYLHLVQDVYNVKLNIEVKMTSSIKVNHIHGMKRRHKTQQMSPMCVT